MHDRRVVLAATVDMRLDSCRRICKAMEDNDVIGYKAAIKMHKDAEKIARKHRMSS